MNKIIVEAVLIFFVVYATILILSILFWSVE